MALAVAYIKRKKSDTELRIALIRQGTDAETAKVIIAEQQRKRADKYTTLRWGSACLGAGLGVLTASLCGLDAENDIVFWFCPVIGLGLALLAAFIAEYRLTRRKHGREEEA